MPTCIKISGAASALLALAALLAADARADWITTAECVVGRDSDWGRIRRYPTDSDATVLAMDGCSLKIIDPAAFLELPNLDTVDLDENNIESINPAVFHTVPSLRKLRLSRNKLLELPVFDKRSCPSLTLLYLNYNKLRMIDEGNFSACTKLEWLELEYNNIEYIHPNAFSALTVLRRLNLNNNKIRFVPDQLLGRNDKLTHLTLSNNRITHLPPDFASSRKLAGAGLKTFKFNGNPWHCKCLVELLADVQRAGVTYYKAWDSIKHYEGTLPECNFIDMYPCRRDAPSAAQGHR